MHTKSAHRRYAPRRYYCALFSEVQEQYRNTTRCSEIPARSPEQALHMSFCITVEASMTPSRVSTVRDPKRNWIIVDRGGVPQGSVLRPTLYDIFPDEFAKRVGSVPNGDARLSCDAVRGRHELVLRRPRAACGSSAAAATEIPYPNCCLD